MKKAYALQKDVQFIFCPYQVCIDMSIKWGEGNRQVFDSGVFLKVSQLNQISHGVQPSECCSHPVGWKKTGDNLFSKMDVWFIKTVKKGDVEQIVTIDMGVMECKAKQDSVLLCQDLEGKPNLLDMWLLPQKSFDNHYSFDPPA